MRPKTLDVKINKNIRLLLFLSTAGILVLYHNIFVDGIEAPTTIDKFRLNFICSFFGIFHYLFPSSKKKTQSDKRRYCIGFFVLIALSLLFLPLSNFSGEHKEYKFLFSKFSSNPQIHFGRLKLQIFLSFLILIILWIYNARLHKIKSHRLNIFKKVQLKPLAFTVLITSICLPVLFAPHEYQHRGSDTVYYKTETKSKALARGQLLILYRPLFTIPDPKASIGRTSIFGTGNFYVYHQRLRVDLLLLYWLLIVLLSGATFFATRQKRVG